MKLPGRLLVATTNAGKRREWAVLLRAHGVEAVSVADLEDVDESGLTVVDNARAKAVQAAAHTGMPALADDIGLAIAALNGAPGTHLKRWALGDFGSWELAQAHCSELAGSAATYQCGLALALPDGTVHTALGEVAGQLVAARGEGPGLEPCFLSDGAADVLTRLTPEERDRFHHRHRALQLLLAR